MSWRIRHWWERITGRADADLDRELRAHLVVVGVVVGAAIAVPAARLIASQLSGVEPTEVLTFGGVAVLLCAAALAAVCLPALRAAKVDPLVALQHE